MNLFIIIKGLNLDLSKSNHDGNWRYYDDTKVSRVNEDPVEFINSLSGDAYLAMYRLVQKSVSNNKRNLKEYLHKSKYF